MEPFYKNEYRNSIEDLYIENSTDSFDNEKALELLLLYTLRIQDAGPVAKRLIEHFGSFKDVINASFEELISVGGMDRDSAVLVSLVKNLVSRAEVEKVNEIKSLKNHSNSEKYFSQFFLSERDKESVHAAFLDKDLNIIETKNVSPIGKTAVKNCEKALKKNHASYVVLAYSSKESSPLPDEKILFFIEELKNVLNFNYSKLLDVIVFSNKKAVSFSNDLRLIRYLK